MSKSSKRSLSSGPPMVVARAEAALARGDANEAWRLACEAGNFGPAFKLRGFLLIRSGREAEGETLLRQGIALAPHAIDIRLMLAQLLLVRGADAAAELEFRQVIALAPALATAYAQLALLIHRQEKAQSSIAWLYRHALLLDPANPEIPAEAGTVFRIQGLFAEALAVSRIACILAPGNIVALHSFVEMSHLIDAASCEMKWFDRLVALEPASPISYVVRARAWMVDGGWRRGFADHEGRLGLPDFAGLRQSIARGPWAGEDVGGKVVLVEPEQGFGDILQFVRFVRPLAAIAKHVFLSARPQLASILAEFAADMPNLTVIREADAGRVTADFVVPVMSLPLVLGLYPDMDGWNFDRPYLAAPGQQRERWAQATAGLSGLKVGICWAGNPRSTVPLEGKLIDRRRSLQLAQLAPLFDCAGARFVSLQHEYRNGDSPAAFGVLDGSGYLNDFGDLAGLIVNLDLVISVDTAVAHLAGALGRPVWLLNRFDTCWRWQRSGTSTPWYAGMRIFRQPTPGDWSSVVADVAAALTAEVSAARSA
ncbi:MAG: glycosyltransferase family 9 protein [Ferrovibrionaceae bacterium]